MAVVGGCKWVEGLGDCDIAQPALLSFLPFLPADVLKCLALGASAVLVGRPFLWALTLGGQRGVEQAAEMLQYELELSMALLGCSKVEQVTADFVIHPPGYPLTIPAARR